MQGLKRLADDGAVRVGRTGTVTVPVPAGNAGPGKVALTLQKRTVEHAASTTAGPLPTGAKVRVVAVRGPAAVEVEPIEAPVAEPN